jgi:outer membrane protein assembly factor BamB
VKDPMDAWVLPGHRILVAEMNDKRITERDRDGKVLWQKAGLGNAPLNVQRLPNGNTFIALSGGWMLEVDRGGKEIYQINNVSEMIGAYRSRQGPIVCLTKKSEHLKVDTTGTPLARFAIKYCLPNESGFLELLPNGRILITARGANKVMEYHGQGNLLHEWNAPGAHTATGLPDGHILVASSDANRVYEMDRDGKVVWEYPNVKAFRARRR